MNFSFEMQTVQSLIIVDLMMFALYRQVYKVFNPEEIEGFEKRLALRAVERAALNLVESLKPPVFKWFHGPSFSNLIETSSLNLRFVCSGQLPIL